MTIFEEPPWTPPSGARPTAAPYSWPTSVYDTEGATWIPPAYTTKLVAGRELKDTTITIGITLQPSDFDLLIPFPTNSIPDSFDPFNPPTTTVQQRTTTLYTTLKQSTAVNRPPSTTLITIFSTLSPAPTECVIRGNPPTANNHKGRAIEYTAQIPDCVTQIPPGNNNNNNNNPNHYTSFIGRAAIHDPQATSLRAESSKSRAPTSFNHKARYIEDFVPNYSTTTLPDYLKNWYVDYYGAIIQQACSCLITSPAAATTIQATTTQYFSVYYVVSISGKGGLAWKC